MKKNNFFSNYLDEITNVLSENKKSLEFNKAIKLLLVILTSFALR